ncbi:hypothetical protein Q5W_09780 [Hydrogenophaga sp. PBC]|uniref:hypothetical protein n=1 Tax=Hydrogenophaga sp. PBC TaxID=795665 RepID=UPI0002607721|nr:hypothetical protein [Hydrogenophaga sp. PBC]AOS79233.1 hypothetical protein Q5W_09780 [Hydrogenophaga sp. PBC]
MNRFNCYDDAGGLVNFDSGEGFTSFSFRWHETSRPGFYDVGTTKRTTDEGRPAKLTRNFRAVADDFGKLVEVPA